MKRTLRNNQHLIWLGLAIAILIAEAFVFHESWRKFSDSDEWFDQTRLTLTRLQGVMSLVTDAETAQRGFLITGHDEYLRPFRAAAAGLPGSFQKLRALASTRAEDERFSQLETLAAERLHLLSENITVRRERGFAASAALMETHSGLELMRSLRELANQIEREQYQLLDRRTLETEQAARVTWAVGTVGSFILLALMAGGTLAIHRDIGRRNKLLELTRQQARIIQSAHEAVTVRDRGGRILSWNTGAAELYGWTEAEAAGMNIHHLLRSRLPIPMEELNATLERDGRWDGEIVQVDSSGRELIVETRQVLVRGQDGTPMGILEMNRDITERKRAEDALWLSRERLELLVGSIELGLFYCDLPFDKLVWNDKCRQHYGVKPGEETTIGFFYDRIHPDDREAVRMAVTQAIEGRSPYDMVYRVVPPGQPVRWLRSIGMAFYDDTGKALRFDGATLDVTAQRRAEDELRESRERLVAALDASGTGTFRWQFASGALDLDENLTRILGLPAGAAPRDLNAWLALVYREDRAAVLAAVTRASRDHEDLEIEFRIVQPDQSLRWVALKGKTFAGTAGEPLYMTGGCLDVTERKRQEEDLRHTQKLESVGLLAGGIAHDFNNLLVGIMGNASLAAETLPLLPGERQILDEVIRASERAADLTRQLLAYAGKGRFYLETVNLSDLLRETSSLVQASISKRVALELELGDVPPVEADRVQMQQVLMNLIINAGEAVGENQTGKVRVSTALRCIDDTYARSFAPQDIPAGDYVELEVADTGCGMDRDTLSRIFDPFFTTKFTGRGLGLAAVQGIVRGHRGALRVYSSPGDGTVFKLLFPVCASAARPCAPEEPAVQLHGTGLMLVVDDELVVRQTAKAVLERYGYTVMVAEDGGAGVELFRHSPEDFSLVLLDLTMPVMGGEEALEQIRAIRPDVPVLLSSGFNQVEAVRQLNGMELAGFLQKPYSGTQLAQAVKAAIGSAAAAEA
ncbi:MAG TPA: PAS domain-containing protein [Bryobacteraceae bacterium]|nr:PAS domain-containing protein [Bryobacteraceae bacterium]